MATSFLLSEIAPATTVDGFIHAKGRAGHPADAWRYEKRHRLRNFLRLAIARDAGLLMSCNGTQCSRGARRRATNATAVKSRARRTAVPRPMPWLAPVTTAADCDISVLLRSGGAPGTWRGLVRAARSAGQKVADRRRDLASVGLQREMARVEEPNHRIRNIAPEGLGAWRQEERVVSAPHRK